MVLDGGLLVGASVPSLVRWGLSPDADLIYRALATVGPRTTSWLAHDLGMPVSRVLAAIDELVAASAVDGAQPPGDHRPRVTRSRSAARAQDRQRTWQALPSDLVVAGLRRRRVRMASTLEQIRRHREMVGLATPHPDKLPARHLPGVAATRSRIAQLAGVERHEHLALNPERRFSAEATAAALPLDRALQVRGVKVRTCGVPPADGDRSSAAASQFASFGADFREATEIPAKLMIFDRKVALLPADPLDPDAGALEIVQPAAVDSMVVLFEQVWSHARDPRKGGVPPIVLSPREQAIVGLLAEGHTDAAVAQRLGISQRTIAYALRELMDRLGVDNRFQLGLVLGATRVAAPPGTVNGEEE